MLIAIVGPLGSGKTLGMTYLIFKSVLKYRRMGMRIRVFANYHLSGIPFYYVHTPDEILAMREGLFGGDELWLWLDSRASGSHRNLFMSRILAKSRKRNVEIFYTTQDISQIDKRIRKITELIVFPSLNKNESICTLYICNRYLELKRVVKFRTKNIFKLYDTTEEVEEIN